MQIYKQGLAASVKGYGPEDSTVNLIAVGLISAGMIVMLSNPYAIAGFASGLAIHSF